MVDLVIRGGLIVGREAVEAADVAVDGGSVVEIGRDLAGGREEIDARGLVVMPGVIDVHLHFNEPGRTEWEGAATGSAALAAGGGTTFFDMPLNSTPCTIGVADFDRKRDALSASSIADFGLWGGLVPGRIDDLAAMAARGVVGFKAFMCDSGLPEFPRADDVTLLEGMRAAAQLKLPIAVHAESEEITSRLAGAARGSDAAAFLASRPLVAELEAIQRALLFAEETGAMLHIVHISSGRGVAMAFEARARGVDVSIETCPHYLALTMADVERLGAMAKCAPPLRSQSDQNQLWSALIDGQVDIVASDHSPCEPSLKQGSLMQAWGGIAGVQSTLAVLLDRGHHARQLPLPRVARLLASAPSRRFRLERKGAIAPGHDADFAIVDLAREETLQAEQLLQRHKSSPYVGRSWRGRIVRTIRRGETIFEAGRISARSKGRLVRPGKME